jgi:NitT/TauT family transport system substrate-binding protein
MRGTRAVTTGLTVLAMLTGTGVLGGGVTAAASSSISASECSANRAAGTITYISPFGFDASAGIIDVFAAEKLGYFSDMCETVDLVTSSQDSTELVSSGRAQVSSIGSAADDLEAVANGADIVGVATYGNISDYAILTQPRITSLEGLKGKSLGYHFTVPVAVLEMLAKAGVPRSALSLIDTTNYDPNQLVQGKLDAIQAYQSNEPLILRAEGARFNEFTPGKLGVKGTFNVQIFNRRFLDQHRQAVADFMRAELHGFAYCVRHQAACVNFEDQYATAAGARYQVSHERQVWSFESGLVADHTLAGKGVGVQSLEEWAPEAKAIKNFAIVTHIPKLSVWENTAIVGSLYDGTTLIWP